MKRDDERWERMSRAERYRILSITGLVASLILLVLASIVASALHKPAIMVATVATLGLFLAMLFQLVEHPEDAKRRALRVGVAGILVLGFIAIALGVYAGVKGP